MTIHPRKDWGSRGIWGYVRFSDRKRNKIVIHHSVTNLAGKTPIEQVQEEENIHFSLRKRKGYGSIAYNFVVSRDGQQWEGMGWDRVTVANWWGDDTIAICIAGNYQPGVPGIENLSPNTEQLTAAAEIIYEGMKLGWIAPDAKIIGHRQAGKTSCPGDNLYKQLDWIGVSLYQLLVERGNPDPNIIPPFKKGVTSPTSGVTNGASGPGVKKIQTLLNKYNKAGLKVDSAFGPATRAAVVAYQKVLGVVADGEWGPLSQAAHDKAIGKTSAVNILKLGAKGKLVKDLQNILNTFSKAELKVDGIFGPATETAVKKYQTALSVTADGEWGPASQSAHNMFMKYLEAQTPVTSPTPPPPAEKVEPPAPSNVDVTVPPARGSSISEPIVVIHPTKKGAKKKTKKSTSNVFKRIVDFIVKLFRRN